MVNRGFRALSVWGFFFSLAGFAILATLTAFAAQTSSVTVGVNGISCNFAGTPTNGVGYFDATNNPSSCANPAVTNIILGDSVQFTWGTSGELHSVSSNPGLVAFSGCDDKTTGSCLITPGSTADVNYECDVHGVYMTGVIHVSIGPLDHFTISPATSTPVAGAGLGITVTARDRNENLVSFSGSVPITSTTDGMFVGTTVSVSGGSGSGTVTLKEAGIQNIHASASGKVG